MIRRADATVLDAFGTPEPNVYITVKDRTGALATLYNDDGSSLANPFQSGSGGTFVYNIADADAGSFTEEYRLSLSSAPKTVRSVLLAIDSGGSSFITPEQYGAVGDNSTNDGAAFAAMVAALRTAAISGYGYSKGAPIVLLGAKHYYLGTTTLDFTVTCRWIGHGGCGAGGPATTLRWAANTTGIRLQAGNTTGATGTQTEDGTGADGTVLIGFGLLGSKVNGGAGADGDYHAIHARTTFKAEDLYIEGWQGDGIYSISTAGGGGADEGNSNNMRLHDIYFENCRRAMFLDGADTNAGYYSGFNIKGMRAEGIYDSCFLQSTHVGHHATSCTGAPYKSDGANARITWTGCYSESGQPAANLAAANTVVGGIHAAGIAGSALQIGSPDLSLDLKGVGASQLGITTIADQTNSGPQLKVHNSQSLAAGIFARLDLCQGIESGTTPMVVGGIRARSSTNSAATAEGVIEFFTRTFGGGGTVTSWFELNGASLYFGPMTDNQIDIGRTAARVKTYYGYTIDLAGNITLMPPASATPASNGQMTFELTSNTQLKVKVKGSDGTVRSTTLTLS